MRTMASPTSSRRSRSATCTMPSGSEAPEPSASLRCGHAEEDDRADPEVGQLGHLLAERLARVLHDARERADRVRVADALADEQRRDEVVDADPGLGHQPPQRRGPPQPAQATLREGHAVEGTAAASSVAPCSLRRKKSRISSARCTRCRGEPDRDSSWLSAGNRWYSCSLPEHAEGDEQLVGLLDVAAQVVLRVEDQHRRGDVLHVGDRRGAQELVGVIEVVDAHHEAEEAARVGRGLEGQEVVAGPLGARRREAVGVADGPRRHVAAVGAAEDADPVRVQGRVPLERGVEHAHHVVVVDAAPAAARPHLGQRRADGPGPVVGLPRRAARVAVHDREARRGPQLELVEPVEAVLRHRSAVDAEQRRHLRGRIGQVDALRGDDPGVDRARRRRRTAPGRARPAGRGPRCGTWRRRR